MLFRQLRRLSRWLPLLSLVLASLPLSAVAAKESVLADSFTTLNPATWHVTDSRDPSERYRCPGAVSGGCLPQNVTVEQRRLAITVPSTPRYSGGQIVSTQTFQYGTFETRLAAGPSHHALNAMFLYSFDTADEIDIEVTYDGVSHDAGGSGACGAQPASNRWEVWFTVWQGGVCVDHAEFPLDRPTHFHRYGITWQEQRIGFSVDNHPLWTTASPAGLSPLRLIFNAYEPTWKNPGENAPVPSTMSVDWVEVRR